MLSRAIAGLLFSLAFLSPVIERFDFWDASIVTGQDTELTVIGVLAICALVIVLARMALLILRLVLRSGPCITTLHSFCSKSSDSRLVLAERFTGSPPPFRI